ncbi:MAG: class I SAM-dependent methyltransferase [Magnetococcales bacterium]|nr:class I SAM-dependent methyltransferase [Magnetococcales bacterium]
MDRERLLRTLYDWEDALFAWRHGFDLGGVIPQERLLQVDSASLAHATAYHAVWCRNLRELFAEAHKTGVTFEHFIDIGSGKGKACFYAALHARFPSILGIEFSRALLDIAAQNHQKLSARSGGARIAFLHADAATVRLPTGTSLIFLFNPFDAIVLEHFLRNNMERIQSDGSCIAYANDQHGQTLAKLGFVTLFRNQTRKLSLWRFMK